MGNPLIKVGERMKVWIRETILKDFGAVSYAKGLYNILYLYKKYVPDSAKRKMKNGRRRLRNGFAK